VKENKVLPEAGSSAYFRHLNSMKTLPLRDFEVLRPQSVTVY